MAQRIDKIKEVTESIKRDGVHCEDIREPETVVKIGDGNTNCNIYYNRRFEDRNATGPYMISCPNCTRRVSRKADACPGCRHPVSLHFQKLALQKAVKTLGVTLALIITATLAMAQTAVAPFLSFAALGNMIALAGAGHALSKIPPHI